MFCISIAFKLSLLEERDERRRLAPFSFDSDFASGIMEKGEVSKGQEWKDSASAEEMCIISYVEK